MVQRRGFTLIELLVVIAIIGLLLSILIPALSRVKEKAEFLFCKSNLKSYGLAMKLYLDDQDDKYPESQTSMFRSDRANADGITLNCQWHDKRISPAETPRYAGPLWQYMDSQKAHMCPTFKKFARVYGPAHPGHNDRILMDPQYAYSQNAFLGRSYGVLKESEVVEPYRVLTWVEETIWRIPDYVFAGVTISPQWVLNDTCFFTRHQFDTTKWGDHIATYHSTPLAKQNDGEGNAVFVDGHIELVDPYQHVQTSWGITTGSFKRAWPRKGVYDRDTFPY